MTLRLHSAVCALVCFIFCFYAQFVILPYHGYNCITFVETALLLTIFTIRSRGVCIVGCRITLCCNDFSRFEAT